MNSFSPAVGSESALLCLPDRNIVEIGKSGANLALNPWNIRTKNVKTCRLEKKGRLSLCSYNSMFTFGTENCVFCSRTGIKCRAVNPTNLTEERTCPKVCQRKQFETRAQGKLRSWTLFHNFEREKHSKLLVPTQNSIFFQRFSVPSLANSISTPPSRRNE